IVERVVRERDLPDSCGGFGRDAITLGWEERTHVHGRRRTDGGVQFGASLPRGTGLRSGDCPVPDADRPVLSVGERPGPGVGLEAAAAGRDGIRPDAAAASLLRAWLDTCLDETIGRLEGPTVWQAWTAFHQRDWQTLTLLDREVVALRPSASARRSTRAMGLRLLTTWQ